MTALHAMSATALHRAFAARELSPVDVVQSVLAHIQRWEPHLQATWALDADAALHMARDSEVRWLRGRALSALDGVPVTIKENIATRGVPMPMGCAATELLPAAEDAPPAARLREAGAVFIGKTTMPDYGMLSSGLSSFHAQFGRLTRNPWDLSKSPGGSSAGAGAAAAAGYGPLHLGTDIGGSLRLPAGWCGIFSLKPSNGRVPIDPPTTGRAAGPMTRSVDDAAWMMRVLSLPDARDSMSLPFLALAWDDVDAGVQKLHGLRIGLLMDAGCGLPVDPEIALAVQDAARLFEQAGAIVEPMQPFMTPAILDGLDHFWRMRSCVDLAALDPQDKARVLPYIRAWADSALGMTATQVFVAATQSHVARVASVSACRGYDYILSPTSPVHAAAAEDPSPTNDPLRGLEHIGFTVPYNMSEQPAASINCGYSRSGMPIGLQIAGQRFDDLGVMQVSRAFELLRGPQHAWPEPPAARA